MTGTGQVDRRAFWIALILAPFALGLMSLILSIVGLPLVAFLNWMELPEDSYIVLFLVVVPLYALIFGLPSYALFGGPVYWWLIKRGEGRWWVFMLAGLVANLGSPLLSLLVEPGGDLAWLMLLFGSGVAPLWSLVFILLYNRRTRHLRQRTDLDEVFG